MLNASDNQMNSFSFIVANNVVIVVSIYHQSLYYHDNIYGNQYCIACASDFETAFTVGASAKSLNNNLASKELELKQKVGLYPCKCLNN